MCRDHLGTFFGASAIVLHKISDPTTLEALGVRESLALVDDFYIQRIRMVSDCKMAIDDTKQGVLQVMVRSFEKSLTILWFLLVAIFFHEFSTSIVLRLTI